MNPSIEARVIEIRLATRASCSRRKTSSAAARSSAPWATGSGSGKVRGRTLPRRARAVPAGPTSSRPRSVPRLVAFGLHTPPNRYDLYCEPLADRIVLPRGAAREEALAAWASRYAARVEHHCRLAPYNWFNFYDFWSTDR